VKLSNRLYDNIDGVTYDTKRAKYIGYAQYGSGPQHAEYKLYQTPGGIYFAHVYGGTESAYALRGGDGEPQASERLIKLDDGETLKLRNQIAEYAASLAAAGAKADRQHTHTPEPAAPGPAALEPAIPEPAASEPSALRGLIAAAKREGYSLDDIAKAYLGV
jgi:hypothetical protein